jgi:hypothetical protein
MKRLRNPKIFLANLFFNLIDNCKKGIVLCFHFVFSAAGYGPKAA